MGGRGGSGKGNSSVVNYGGKSVKVYQSPPSGYKKDSTASAPRGMEWWNNGKSRFSGKRKSVLVQTDKSKSASQLIKESAERSRKKEEQRKNATEKRYERPQQQSTTSKRQQRSLQNKLKGYIN